MPLGPDELAAYLNCTLTIAACLLFGFTALGEHADIGSRVYTLIDEGCKWEFIVWLLALKEIGKGLERLLQKFDDSLGHGSLFTPEHAEFIGAEYQVPAYLVGLFVVLSAVAI